MPYDLLSGIMMLNTRPKYITLREAALALKRLEPLTKRIYFTAITPDSSPPHMSLHMRCLASFLLALIAILIASCSLFGEDEKQTARISERGIDNIYFGDSIAEVEAKLGLPRADGWADGPWRSWYHRIYGPVDGTGPLDSLMIYFTIPSGGPDSASVVDAFGVRGSYSGKTTEGVGIGSTRADVFEALGEPLFRREATNELLYYCLGTREVEFIISSDTVQVILMGFHEPLEDYYIQCE